MPVKQKDRDKLEKIAKVHRIIADVAGDPDVLAALDDLTDSAEERNKAAADFEQWVKDRNIKLPPGKVFFKADNWYCEYEFETEDRIVRIGYDSVEGLFAYKG